jgi:cellulose biosynthesis protein BcsQ
LAGEGKRSLIIDLDSNCAVSEIFGAGNADYTALGLLTSDAPVKRFQAMPGIDLLPGDLKMGLFFNVPDNQLKSRIKKQGLRDQYDYILIDPPGTWGPHARNAIMAADRLIIPATCSDIDFRATALFIEELMEYDIETDVSICINNYEKNAPSEAIFGRYQAQFGEFLMETPVPKMLGIKWLLADPANRPLASRWYAKAAIAAYTAAVTKSNKQGEENADS